VVSASALQGNSLYQQYIFSYLSSSQGIPLALDYIQRRGVSLYEDYPLHPLRMQGECLVKSSNRKIYIAGYKELPCNADAETTLKNAVMHQPVIATIFVGEEFDHYRAGDDNFQTEASSGENHAVLVICFGERDGRKYWLIRNSYGTQWGYKGYGLIERGVGFFGRCGIAFICYYLVWEVCNYLFYAILRLFSFIFINQTHFSLWFIQFLQYQS
jgi:hypothetical protein